MYTIFLVIFSVIFIILLSTYLKVHPFLSLIAAAFLFGLLSGMPLDNLVQTINEGFGKTIGNIGIIIIAGIIIGAFLENTGGANVLAGSIIKMVGEKRVYITNALMGYLISIPVFADSGFIILSSLNRALTRKAKLSLAGTAIALSLGLTATHTMVPPTPGPIAAAGILGADLGRVILIGLAVSLCTLTVSVIFSKHAGKKIFIDPGLQKNENDTAFGPNDSPSAIKSFLPIVIPIALIVLRSIAEYPTLPLGEGRIKILISFFGNPVVALFCGVLLSLMLPKKLDRSMLSASGWAGEALKSAAIIILITGAGGAFGNVLQSSNISEILSNDLNVSGLGIWLPFLLAAALKTSQGSSTVAIITTASIITPVLHVLGLESETSRALVVVAIGAGSAVASHVNDSFFWIVTQMSNMTVKQGYRLQTLGTAVMGFSAMIFLSILSLFIS